MCAVSVVLSYPWRAVQGCEGGLHQRAGGGLQLKVGPAPPRLLVVELEGRGGASHHYMAD